MAGTINKPKKPSSKRTTTRLRKRIEKGSQNKQRQAKKKARNNPEWRSKLKKDPGIPNLFPYKAKLLQEIEEKKIQKQEETRRKRELAKAARTAADEDTMVDEGDEDVEEDEDEDMSEDAGGDDSNPMAALLASARRAAEMYDKDLRRGDGMEDDGADFSEADVDDIPVGQDSSRKAYDKVFKNVVEQADVVIYVLDARDPEGTRSREVEQSVMAAAGGGKRLILVINKIDLIPPKVLQNWLVYLRRYFPTLPLRAAASAPNAQTFNHKQLTVQNTSTTLFRALKSFAATRQLKRAVSVGVIGYPNVGKSSVINSLLARMNSGRGGNASKACPAGAEAGVTTSIRAVKIDSKLTLLDSPGIVFPSTSSISNLVNIKNATDAHAHLVLLNAIPPKQIDDPIPAVSLLLRRLSSSSDLLQKLTETYDLPPLLTGKSGGDLVTDFLVQVARKRGRLGRGGIPNLNSAAMTVVTDWRDGRIQGWIEPPVLPIAGTVPAAPTTGGGIPSTTAVELPSIPDQKEIVTEWAQEFKLEGLWGDSEADAEDVADEDTMHE